MATSSMAQNNANAIYFDHITCNVCLEVLEDPVQCVKNEHHFCKKCITKHLGLSKTCPVCQDTLTSETLRPTSRIVANLLKQFQSPKCRYASRGCTSAVRHESLLSHHNECGFAPVQCLHEGCEATINRQDADSHQQKCEFRLIACDDCHEFMKQHEYEKHPCLFRKEIHQNKHGLAELQKILGEIRNEQVSSSCIKCLLFFSHFILLFDCKLIIARKYFAVINICMNATQKKGNNLNILALQKARKCYLGSF